VEDEEFAVDQNPGADEAVALDLASRSDHDVALNLDERTDSCLVADPAAGEVRERRDDDISALRLGVEDAEAVAADPQARRTTVVELYEDLQVVGVEDPPAHGDARAHELDPVTYAGDASVVSAVFDDRPHGPPRRRPAETKLVACSGQEASDEQADRERHRTRQQELTVRNDRPRECRKAGE